MSLELIIIVAIVVIIIGGYVFFAIAKRALRLAIRMTLFFALVLVVLVAGLLVWYQSGSKSSPQQNRPTNTRRGNSR